MIEFKLVTQSSRDDYIRMAREFYPTGAVMHPVDDLHFEAGFAELMRSDEYMFSHIFIYDGAVAGYALISKTFSQEAGGMVWWIEEIYILPQYRGKGIGSKYLRHLLDTRPPSVKRFRLEVELENEGAVALYRRLGFDFLEYDQMYVDF